MKYYLTYYEAYPIYEHAEGGYYYEGRTASHWWEIEDVNLSRDFDELLNLISNFAEEFEIETIPFDFDGIKNELEKWGYSVVALTHAKYIGDDEYLVLETERAFKKYESGWHPYE